jgi:hypothetical protein
MDARINDKIGPRENFEPENYRGYVITYARPGCIFEVTNDKGYRRGVSSLRKDAKHWIDMLIEGKVK